MRSLVVGATAGLGRGLAMELARRGSDVLIAGRDREDLQRVAADLTARFGVPVQTIVADASAPLEFAAALTDAIGDGPLDVAMLPFGVSISDDLVTGAPTTALELVNVNLVAVVTASMAIADVMRAKGTGVIIGFSSIAAARGRARNAAYAAAKRGVESWFESLRADLEEAGVGVACYVLGYLDTNLSYGQKLPLPVAQVDQVAARVVSRMHTARGRQFAPAWWRVVALVVRSIPFGIFRRLKS